MVSKAFIGAAMIWMAAAPLLAGTPSPIPSAAATPSGRPAESPRPKSPKIQTLLKPEQYRRLTTDREILSSASLEDLPGDKTGERYFFYVAMQVKAGLERTRRILTDYTLYSKLIPYVDKTTYSPITRVLDVEGGLWKWRLRSLVRFDEKNDHWIHYQIVGGHFRGLEGDMYFEEAPDKGTTLVYFRGEQQGTQWPPKLVIERGAEIVFGFTAGRMRKYVESREDRPAHDAQEVPEAAKDSKAAKEKNSNDGQKLPQPRSRL